MEELFILSIFNLDTQIFRKIFGYPLEELLHLAIKSIQTLYITLDHIQHVADGRWRLWAG
jgi:hypothetical protein